MRCINFTNESLHNLFIEHVFKLEQEVYVREEVEWSFVSYEDNQHVIDLIAKRPLCILGLLDEGDAASILERIDGDDDITNIRVHELRLRAFVATSAVRA